MAKEGENSYNGHCNISGICSTINSTPSGVRIDGCENINCKSVNTRHVPFIEPLLENEENLDNIAEILKLTCEAEEGLLCRRCKERSKTSFIAVDAHLLILVDGLRRKFSSITGTSFKIEHLEAHLELQDKR